MESPNGRCRFNTFYCRIVATALNRMARGMVFFAQGRVVIDAPSDGVPSDAHDAADFFPEVHPPSRLIISSIAASVSDSSGRTLACPWVFRGSRRSVEDADRAARSGTLLFRR